MDIDFYIDLEFKLSGDVIDVSRHRKSYLSECFSRILINQFDVWILNFIKTTRKGDEQSRANCAIKAVQTSRSRIEDQKDKVRYSLEKSERQKKHWDARVSALKKQLKNMENTKEMAESNFDFGIKQLTALLKKNGTTA